jgi:hypothetical protein
MKLCFTQLVCLYIHFKMFEGVHDTLKDNRKCIGGSQYHATDVYKFYIEYKGKGFMYHWGTGCIMLYLMVCNDTQVQ